jgi:hypothetical protein
MKNIILTFAAASLFAVMPIMPAPAFADPASADSGIVTSCKTDIGDYPEEPLGNCLAIRSTNKSGAPGIIPNVCAFFQTSLPDYFYSQYDSFQDCVLDAGSNL